MGKIYKVGSELVIKKDFELNGFFSEDGIPVKVGDKGFVDANGYLHFTTGKARGKISRLADAEIKGVDCGNIAKMIFHQLERNYNLSEHLDDNDLTIEDFVDDIFFVLGEIF